MKERLAIALGLLSALAAVLAYPALLESFERTELLVELEAPDVGLGPRLDIRSEQAGPLFVDGKPARGDEELGSGLHHMQWAREYRGGHRRRVGHTQLLGPFQDHAAPPCSAFLLVSQELLDDGGSSPNTMAHIVRSVIERELAGTVIWPLGRYRKIRDLSLRWQRWQDGAMLANLRALLQEGLDSPLSGHLRVELDLAFEKGHVPLRLTLVPRILDGAMKLKVFVNAELKFKSRLYQIVADIFDGNDRVSRIVDGQIRDGLHYILDKPPSIPLGEGAFLDLEFCRDRQLLFHERGFVAVPLAISLSPTLPAPPLEIVEAMPMDRELHAPMAIDIDRNGLNALIHTLWSSGQLDRHLARSMVSAFNEQESVQRFLSLRVAAAGFHLPPTIELLDQGFRLRAAAAATLVDGDLKSEARLFTQISFPLSLLQPGATPRPASSLDLESVELSCLPAANQRKACYGQIVEQVRANQEDLQQLLSGAFVTLLRQVLSHREIKDSSTPARFHLQETRFVSQEGQLRAELVGQLAEITD